MAESGLVISDEAARWFEERRGIKRETLEAFGVKDYVTPSGVEQPGAVVFAYPGGFRRLRDLHAEGDGRFRWLEPTPKGRIPGFLPPNFKAGKNVFLVEGETDLMALYQNMPEGEGLRESIVAVPGLPQFPKHIEELVKDARRVFVIYDNDKVGYDEDKGQVVLEKPASQIGWEKVKEKLGRKARRVILPPGIKDVAEFFQEYSWEAFAVLLRRAAEPVRHYKRLDLGQRVPDVKWLVEDLLVSYEAHVLGGDGGSYKSWFCQALALSVAGSDNTFVGLPITRHGRVLYVDEEQSADLVLQRLTALGMTEEHRQNLEYLWWAGVDLANEPEKLLEEALDLEPELIVIESLSRVAVGVEENSNTEMTRLLKQGIVPLARESGAAVLVTHHTDKDGARIRGAGSIRNAADQTIGIKKADGPHVVNIFPDKPRRELRYINAQLVGSMKAGEPVRWALAEEGMPF